MDTQNILTASEEALRLMTVSKNNPENNRLDIEISSSDLIDATRKILAADTDFYLSAITGLDLNPAPAPAEQTGATDQAEAAVNNLEVLYHFCSGAAVLTLRVKVALTNPVIPSVCTVIPSASLYEREVMELFGIHFTGTPDTSRLLLSDDWPQGVYPLRKSFTGLPSPSTEVKGS